MPTFMRSQLRQDLGRLRLFDTVVGVTTLSLGVNGTMGIMDQQLANPANSGQGFYQNAWFRCGSGPNGSTNFDYQVGTGNWFSGAALSLQPAQAAIASGMVYELSTRLSPSDKDRCLDMTISRFRVKQEVILPSVDGMREYSGVDTAASPNAVLDVLNVYYFADPTSSMDKKVRYFDQQPVVAMTASGTRVLRVPANVSASQQIVMQCLLQMTLGSSDSATVNFPVIPDDQAILDSAAAYAYNLLIQKGPSQEVALFRELRKEHATNFTNRMRKQMAEQNVEIGFDSIMGPESPRW